MSDKPRIKPAERMKIARVEMPQQEPCARSARFTEVNLGLPEHVAKIEAERCLQCKKAKCIPGCPVGVDVPAFVARIAEGDFRAAADIMYRDNLLPGITGRVCPQETQCEQACVRGNKHGAPVAIGYLERFIADWARENPDDRPRPAVAPTGRRVAIVGAGPAGLTAAGVLARLGHDVTIFEALHEPGGVLLYGIPEFRLPKEIVRHEVETLRALGVKIETNVVIGRTCTIDELLHAEGFHAVFIANGAGLPILMGIPGEQLKGVYSANEFLTRVNLMHGYEDHAETPVLVREHMVVVGGGNTAMDAVRTARRLGARHATLVYRRSREEMPARLEEIQHAIEEGIELRLLTNPVAILGDEHGWVRAVECVRMELGEPDASGRRRPVPVEGSNHEIPCGVFIEALGTRANPLLTQTTPDLRVSRNGYIEIDEFGQTSKPGVFAGGDIVRGSATVILAMGDGKRAAASIDRYLRTGAARPLESSAAPAT
jgi:glutamate synthase (NADPH/NADH) small chain